MREILFRAKAVNRDRGYHRTDYKNGDWVYGLIYRLYDERFENLPAEMTDINNVDGVEVDYKTIGQYTGLTDKNGEMIFEGDTCRVTKPCILAYGTITFKNGSFLFEESNSDSVLELFRARINQFEIEVIGSIHDNPELLKGGAE